MAHEVGARLFSSLTAYVGFARYRCGRTHARYGGKNDGGGSIEDCDSVLVRLGRSVHEGCPLVQCMFSRIVSGRSLRLRDPAQGWGVRRRILDRALSWPRHVVALACAGDPRGNTPA